MKCVLVAQELDGSRCLSCSIFVRMKIVCHPVSHVATLLASPQKKLTFSHPVHTKHHLGSTTFSKTTLHTENLFQELHGRKATLKNSSRTSSTRVAETCEQTLPQVMSPKSLQPRSLRLFLEDLWKTFINFTMYLEKKLLTSPLYAQGASGRPDAMVVQEREVSSQTPHSSEDHRAPATPAALFSPKRNEQRNQMWSSVFGNANLSN